MHLLVQDGNRNEMIRKKKKKTRPQAWPLIQGASPPPGSCLLAQNSESSGNYDHDPSLRGYCEDICHYRWAQHTLTVIKFDTGL